MKRLFAGITLAVALWPALAQAQDAPAPATPPAASDPSPQDELYHEALRAISEGRLDDASAMLERVLQLEPRHAGAWLDLAISQCELGNPTEAERLFSGLERRVVLPVGIAKVIARYRATGCGARTPLRQGGIWLLAATRGHDDNVNQGASNPRFAIGTGSAQTDYELDPAYLPKADSFKQLAASYLRPFQEGGTNVVVQAYSRWHDHEHVQDTASVLGAVEHKWQPGAWQLRGTVALGYVSLDRRMYQRQGQLQVRLAPPLPLAPEAEFALSANLSRVDYPTRPAYDGSTLELGGVFNYRNKANLTQATLTRLHDYGSADRPGGDRDGWYGNLQWSGEITDRLTLEAGAAHQLWRSARIYSPGLIETRRLQNTTTLHATAQWLLRPHTNVVLEWRGALNRENISLFQYNSHALQLSLRWDNF